MADKIFYNRYFLLKFRILIGMMLLYVSICDVCHCFCNVYRYVAYSYTQKYSRKLLKLMSVTVQFTWLVDFSIKWRYNKQNRKGIILLEPSVDLYLVCFSNKLICLVTVYQYTSCVVVNSPEGGSEMLIIL